MSAGAYENPWTPDLSREAGYAYIVDWPHDDQPICMRALRPDPVRAVPG
jgi:allantoinase